jgi:hypothetical protein
MTLAKVTGVASAPETDGGHVIQVASASGEITDVLIPVELAAVVVHILQPGVLERACLTAQNLSLPRVDVHRFDVVHEGRNAELMARIEQMGFVVLGASDDALRHLRSEIDRVLTYRSASPATH